MASTCDVYKNGIKIGAGSVAAGSTSLTSWVPTSGASLPAVARRNVRVQITQAGTNVGRSFNTQILTDNGAGTLTMRDACPFVGA
jgi:hypothetical protein